MLAASSDVHSKNEVENISCNKSLFVVGLKQIDSLQSMLYTWAESNWGLEPAIAALCPSIAYCAYPVLCTGRTGQVR